jgi:hypothetical protein
MTGSEGSTEDVKQTVDGPQDRYDQGTADEHADSASGEKSQPPPQTKAYGAEGVDTEDPVVPPGPLPGESRS